MILMLSEFTSTPPSELRKGVERKDEDALQAKSFPTSETLGWPFVHKQLGSIGDAVSW